MTPADIKLRITYDVVAYDDSGYGDNRSQLFDDEASAVAYARKLRASADGRRFEPITITKHIRMEPISIKVDW